MPSPQVQVAIDLARVQANVRAIQARTGVPLYAVIKADAYGLGAAAVVRALAPLVAGFYAFSPAEARAAGTPATGKPCIVMLHGHEDPAGLAADQLRPAVFSLADAQRYAAADPFLSIDVGMERYGCPPAEAVAILRAGLVKAVLAHAVTPEQVTRFRAILASAELTRPVHAQVAASALLDHPPAWLDATRPGLALYADAVRVSCPFFAVRDSAGPAGYGGFRVARHGVILAGYAHGLWRGVVLVNGQPREILEIGMQSAFIKLAASDQLGDEVVLLGEGLRPAALAQTASAAGTHISAHEALLRACALGQRHWSAPPAP